DGARRPPPCRLVAPDSLEELALEALLADEPADAATVVGLGGGLALDVAKWLALRTARPVVLLPSVLSTIAPFTAEAERRVRRQLIRTEELDAARVVVDVELIRAAPPERTRAGAAELASIHTALWDWRFADSRGHGVPFSPAVAAVGERALAELADAAEEVAAVSADGVRTLAQLLAAVAGACARAGHRRLFEGAEHTFVQAYEHRLARPASYGGLLALSTSAFAVVQQNDPDRVVELLKRCGAPGHPSTLELTEDTFLGLLRHTVRFAVGESLPYSILNEADLNGPLGREMWRAPWRLAR
ncbi:MAG: iron-containing alcohol dehydrogenase, partial [Acidimicrobiales bacterium]